MSCLQDFLWKFWSLQNCSLNLSFTLSVWFSCSNLLSLLVLYSSQGLSKRSLFLWSKVWFFDPLPSSPIKHSCLDSYTRMYFSGNLPFYLSTKFAKSRTFPLKISLVWFSIRKWSLSLLSCNPTKSFRGSPSFPRTQNLKVWGRRHTGMWGRY